MLFKRTCLLINYEDANRALDKAKPGKKSAVIFHSSIVVRLHNSTSSMWSIITDVDMCLSVCLLDTLLILHPATD